MYQADESQRLAIMSNIGFVAYLRRDLLLAYRRRGEAASPLVFFMLVATLIPLGVSPDSAKLATGAWYDLGHGITRDTIVL